MKTTFKNMTRACVPGIWNTHANSNGSDISSIRVPNSMSFYKLIEESRWVYQVDLNLIFRLFILVTKNFND
jgi:hypothetical protein